jgi:hypothetical protein
LTDFFFFFALVFSIFDFWAEEIGQDRFAYSDAKRSNKLQVQARTNCKNIGTILQTGNPSFLPFFVFFWFFFLPNFSQLRQKKKKKREKKFEKKKGETRFCAQEDTRGEKICR